MKKSSILLTNDDGIQSPGLAAAASALHPLGELRIVAPLHQQTAMGRAHTGAPDATLLPQRFFAGGKQLQAFACDASPASAVGHGLMILQETLPDLVVSGINYGENLGTNITTGRQTHPERTCTRLKSKMSSQSRPSLLILHPVRLFPSSIRGSATKTKACHTVTA